MTRSAKLPCELIIWYVLPDLRNEISRTLLDDYNYKQVEIARALGVTKAAVNQYLSSKRGENFFNIIKDKKTKNMIMKELRKSTASIVSDQSTIDVELCRLCNVIKGNKIIFKVYEKYSEGILPQCIVNLDKYHGKSTSLDIKTRKLKCSGCNKELQENWLACPFCGVTVATNCTDCKSRVELSWKVCPYCAKKISSKNTKASGKKKN